MLFEDLKCYREGLLAQGFWALQVHRLGSVRRHVRYGFIRKPIGFAHAVMAKLCELLFGITIGRNAVLGRRLTIEHYGHIIIHGNAVIGDDVTIRQGVTIGNRYTDRPLEAPVIGSRVNIGAGAALLGNIVIGDDVDIGANAVVLRDVPSNHIAVGVPARILPKKQRTGL